MRLSLKTRALLYLGYDIFSELISLAKTNGCILELKKEEDMRGVAAYIYHDGDIDSAGRTVCGERISLSEPIDVDAFRAEIRPELNFGKIPLDQIYRFVVYHEIGHSLLDNPRARIRRNANGTVNEEETQMVRLACELMADRYAWNSLFPLQPYPSKKGCESTVKSLEAFIRDHKDVFTNPRAPKPLQG